MINVLGIDCAVNDKDTGISIGEYLNGKLKVKEAYLLRDIPLNKILDRWYDSERKNLIAIDAPLGWPAAMGVSLKGHLAGQFIEAEANELFRRETDRFVKRVTNKQSLDVGADKIARTAYAALKLLQEIKNHLGENIDLAWEPVLTQNVSVIEVYPAVTLQRHIIRSDRYKKAENIPQRVEIFEELKTRMDIIVNNKTIEKSDDILDSIVCQLAAKDFLNGDVEPPVDIELAKKEGWIWFRKGCS